MLSVVLNTHTHTRMHSDSLEGYTGAGNGRCLCRERATVKQGWAQGDLFFHLSCASCTYSGMNVSLDKHNVKFPDKDILTSEL